MADDYSLIEPLKDITRMIKEICENPGYGEVRITIEETEVKFINETYKNKY